MNRSVDFYTFFITRGFNVRLIDIGLVTCSQAALEHKTKVILSFDALKPEAEISFFAIYVRPGIFFQFRAN